MHIPTRGISTWPQKLRIGSTESLSLQFFGEDTGRVERVDLFDKVAHVLLRVPRGVSFWNMHSQGFGGIIIQWMQIFEENTGRVGGVDLLEEIVHVGL